MWNKNERYGTVDQAKGKVKELVGTLTRNHELKAEGRVDARADRPEDTLAHVKALMAEPRRAKSTR